MFVIIPVYNHLNKYKALVVIIFLTEFVFVTLVTFLGKKYLVIILLILFSYNITLQPHF